MAASLDPRALEERTQAIGQELFAAAKRESAHLSVLNRWTQQVLAWCLADPTLKSSVLRFIDVLPSLRSPRAIARHVLEYFPTTNLRLPSAFRPGGTRGPPRPLPAPPRAPPPRGRSPAMSWSISRRPTCGCPPRCASAQRWPAPAC